MGILDIFTADAGQKRRQWLNQNVNAPVDEAMRYYLGAGNSIPQIAGLLAEGSPVASIDRAGTNAQEMFLPDRSITQRMTSAGNMLSETAGAGLGLLGAPAASKVGADLLTDVATRVSKNAKKAGDFAATDMVGAARAIGSGDMDFLTGWGSPQSARAAGADVVGQVSPIPELSKADQLRREANIQRFGYDPKEVIPEPVGFDLFHGTPHEFRPSIRIEDMNNLKTYVQEADDPIAKGFLAQNPNDYRIVDENPIGMFDFNKMGSGEGAQAYGWGGYFTETPDIARGYRDGLLTRSSRSNNAANPINLRIGRKPIEDLYSEISMGADRMPTAIAQKEYNKLAMLEDIMKEGDLLVIEQRAASGAYDAPTMDWFNKNIKPKFNREGALYQTRVNADPETFLNLDLPIKEQTQKVQSALGWTPEAKAEVKRVQKINDENLEKALKDEIPEYNEIPLPIPKGAPPLDSFGMEVAKGGRTTDLLGNVSPENISKSLLEKGISGSKFLDAGSRGMGWEIKLKIKGQDYPTEPIKARSRSEADRIVKEYQDKGFETDLNQIGTRNYVVFDDKLLSIVKKYGIAGAASFYGVSEADISDAFKQNNSQSLLPKSTNRGLL
jgi:hypothetical protein